MPTTEKTGHRGKPAHEETPAGSAVDLPQRKKRKAPPSGGAGRGGWPRQRSPGRKTSVQRIPQNRENGVVLVKVYVSHPLRGNVEENRGRVDEICRRISEEHPDVTILSPIHNFGYVSPLGPQEWVLEQCRRLVTLADELWVYGSWMDSEGCRMEIALAETRGIPVVFQEAKAPPVHRG